MIIAKQKIKSSIVNEIGKFAILWSCFERYCCNNHCNSSILKNKSELISISDEKAKILHDTLKKRMEINNNNTNDYIQCGLYPKGSNQHSKDDELYMEQFINDSDKPNDNIIGCLLVIQRIRNNMMHGLKDIHGLEEQIDLFQAVNGVLENICEHYFNTK